MKPVIKQALKAVHDGFVTDTYIQCISGSLLSLTNILAENNLGVLFNNSVRMQLKVLNVNNIGQNMGEEIYSIHCLTDCETTNVPMCYVLVPRKGCSFQTDREPFPTSSSTF